ncbi:MAG: type I methionyl aminopeptidase [Rickettsiales bacterium]|jgi:methionyl aminopeptidase|nr:type I methionyl aminopeptidase [Rickettsiales bacterium]
MIYSETHFKGVEKAGRLAAETLDFITDYVSAGISTFELDKLVAEHTRRQGATCATLGYMGYPKSCCISLNSVICHGIPSKHEYLKDGDILNIDVTTESGGYFGDTSRMYAVGRIPPRTRELIDVTYDSMMAAISICRPGQSFAEIGRTIQGMCEARGFSVVRDFCGHGTGTSFHEEPNVLHYYDSAMEGEIMREGQIFTIEPMVNTGGWKMEIGDDDWTATTVDGGLSAQFEHTVGITKTGVKIFTLSPKGYTKPPYRKESK